MYALETVTVQPQPHARPRQERISNNIRRVIDLMVHEGKKRSEAAAIVGILDESARQALVKPNVLAYLNHQKGVKRTSAQSRTIAVAESLLDATSESVRLDAVKYLDPPVQRSENIHVHQHHIPGLTIVHHVTPAPGDDALLIADQRIDPERAKLIKSLPKPVPHPAMKNAAMHDNTHYGKSEANVLNDNGNSERDKAASGQSSTPSGMDAHRPASKRQSRKATPGGQK